MYIYYCKKLFFYVLLLLNLFFFEFFLLKVMATAVMYNLEGFANCNKLHWFVFSNSCRFEEWDNKPKHELSLFPRYLSFYVLWFVKVQFRILFSECIYSTASLWEQFHLLERFANYRNTVKQICDEFQFSLFRTWQFFFLKLEKYSNLLTNANRYFAFQPKQ